MAVGLIAILQRILPVETARSVTEFVIENADTFVGLDLADNEVGFDSKPFREVFDLARESGLDITPVITHRFSYRDFEDAFAVARSGQSGKVILDWTQLEEG